MLIVTDSDIGGAEVSQEEKLIRKMLRYAEGGQIDALSDAYVVCSELQEKGKSEMDCIDGSVMVMLDPENHAAAQRLMRDVRAVAAKYMRGGISDAADIYKDCLKFAAPYYLDEAIRYAEFNRPYNKKFYEPRRKQLKPLVDDLQRLEDGELEMLGISLAPGVGKTTLAEFFMVWTSCKHPELSSICASHSSSIIRGLYDEMLRMLDPNEEYLFHEIFPLSTVVGKNANDLRIDLKTNKRFQTLQYTSLGASNSGKLRATNILYCDDLIDGIETALSKERTDKVFTTYASDFRQRELGGCKELMIATRWSLFDPLGRLEELHRDNPKAKFINLPVWDENEESLFDYPMGLGHSTAKLKDIQRTMDDMTFNALYLGQPVEREGRLYHPDELRRYFTLPDKEPDAIVTVCDIADGGGDYWVCPITFRFGSDYYIEDFICDNGKPDVVEERIVEALLRYKVQAARVETNRGGGRVAESIQRKVKERGGLTKITTKWNQTQKDTRIIMASGMIKQNFLFKDESVYTKEYRNAMNMLTGYTMSGKNKHDDVPDAMSMLTDMIQGYELNTVKVFKRPF